MFRRRMPFLISAAVLLVGCTASPSITPAPSPSTAASGTATASPALTLTLAPSPAGRVISGADFTRSGGCGDVFMWAVTADDAMAITVEWQGAATAAWDEDAFDETEDLPQPQIRVGLVVGRQLSQTYCNDVLMPGSRVDGDAPAVSGNVALVVQPDAGGFEPGSHADLTLQDVAFEIVLGTDTENWVLDHLELQDISVGWFAG